MNKPAQFEKDNVVYVSNTIWGINKVIDKRIKELEEFLEREEKRQRLINVAMTPLSAYNYYLSPDDFTCSYVNQISYMEFVAVNDTF